MNAIVEKFPSYLETTSHKQDEALEWLFCRILASITSCDSEKELRSRNFFNEVRGFGNKNY